MNTPKTSHIERVAYPRVPVACLGKPLLQRRPRLNGAVMQNRNATTGGRGLQSFHHPWQEPQRFSYIEFRRTSLESGCSTNKNCCHRSSVLSLVSVLRIKVCYFPVSGEVTSYNLPVYGAVASHSLPVYGAVTPHSLPVYGALTTGSLPFYDVTYEGM